MGKKTFPERKENFFYIILTFQTIQESELAEEIFRSVSVRGHEFNVKRYHGFYDDDDFIAVGDFPVDPAPFY